MCKNLICYTVLGLLLGMMASATHADIIAYWPFDEGTGDVATDIVGDFEAQLTDVDWVADQFGGFALDSGGGGDEILVDPAPTPTTEDLSLAWWMVDTYDSWHTMMNKSETDSTAGYAILLRPSAEDSPLRFRIGGFQAYGGWGAECRLPGGAYEDGEWVHITCTYDSASDTATIYVNAEVKPYGANNPKVGGIAGPDGYCEGLNDPTQPLYIAGQRETFQGTVDDVAIWDHALSPSDIVKVFNLGPLALDPRLAGRPSPADAATDLPRETALGWSAGEEAVAHDVYLGTDFTDVNDADRGNPLLVNEAQADTTYDPPGRLEFGTTYYWRIDEVQADGTTVKGAVWSFTTEPVSYPVDGQTITVTASSAAEDQGPENTINGSGLTGDEHSDVSTDMWLTAMDDAGPASIEYEFDRVLSLDRMQVWNQNGLLEPTVGLGAKDVTIEYSVDGVEYMVLEGTPEFARAPGKAGYAPNTTVDFDAIATKFVKLTINSNWGGILNQYGLSEVRFFSIPVFAREPNPMPGQGDVDVAGALTWRAGREADSHQVYVGTDQQAVADGNAPVETVASPSYMPSLDLASTYYWRVDEVNEVETPSVWPGDVWGFSTQEFIAVDDFEDYTDDLDADEAVFQTWADGFEDDTNGALVGKEFSAGGTFNETANVHGGKQSMPLAYDNSTATSSEATRTFDTPQDWSLHGIKGLTLWFYGDPMNDAQEMYVKINGTKVPYDGAAENLQAPNWQMWYIDLTALNVSNVQTLSVGFDRVGAVGGQGMVLIDDIRLYAYDRQLITPTDPGTAGLQAQFLFDGDAADSSGNGRAGTLMGSPAFVTGQSGQAIQLDGVDDYVNIDDYKGILADADGVQNPFTLSAWINVTSDGEIITWGTNAGGQRMTFRVDTVLRVEHGAGNVRATNGPDLRDGEWHHVAATIPQGAGIMDVTLYVDGSNAAPPSTNAAAFNLQPDLDVRIGMGGPTGGRFLTGVVDDARIYDRVLSAGEVAYLAGKTVPFDESF